MVELFVANCEISGAIWRGRTVSNQGSSDNLQIRLIRMAVMVSYYTFGPMNVCQL